MKEEPKKEKKETKATPKTDVFFDEVWNEYPRRVGKKAALKSFLTSVKTKEDLILLKQALETYKKSARVKKGFIQNGRTWFANWQDWVDYSENVCKDCNGNGRYTSKTGYKIICKCPAGEKYR